MMDMTPQPWTISALAQHLDVDRRRIAKAVKEVKPAGQQGRSTTYWLSDAVRAIFAPAELDVQQETAKLRKAQTEKTQIQIYRDRGELLDAVAVEKVWTDMSMAFRAKVLGIPSALSPQLVGLPVSEIEDLIRVHIEMAMAELKDYEPGSYQSSGADRAESIGDDVATPKAKRKRVGGPRKSAVKRSKRGAGKVADG